MESSRSLRTRAVMALLLMVGFYGFALAIALGLLWVPYAEYAYLDRIDGRIAIFCVVGAITILYALVPRIDRFEAPGPRLTPANAPQLFTIIHECARATSQPRPEEVYLLPDVNAFVTQRGGLMGFGSKRVMGVGLPLVKGLSASELRSVIAHEFGHYVSGDVALGPWIYKTRATIGRTLQGVSGNWLLEKLFDWYGRIFMRMTTQVSREQEFVADATAARVAGAAAAISALKRTEVLAPAFSTYMDQEVMPVLRAGYLPPVAEGFEHFMSDPDTAKAFRAHAAASAHGAAGEFDTHPPTGERIAVLQRIKEKPKSQAAESSAQMLKEPSRHVRALLEHSFGKDAIVKLKAVDWDDVGAKVYSQLWEEQAQRNAKWLGTLTADRIPSDKQWFARRAKEIPIEPDGAPDEFRLAVTIHVLTCAVGAALLARGWTFETAPGKPIMVVKGIDRFNPREAIQKLAAGALPVEDWRTLCASMGISGVALAHQSKPTTSKV